MHFALRCLVLFGLPFGLATVIVSGDAGARPKRKHTHGASAAATPANAKGVGRIHGTVAWAGRAPEFADEGCAVQQEDSVGHPEITGGLAHVVVIAEPLSPGLQKVFRRPPPKAGTVPPILRVLDWTSTPSGIATARPGLALSVRTTLTLRFYAGDRLVGTVAPSTMEDGHILLPEGVIKVVDERNGLGWVYVTPYPSRTSSGTCRFSFIVPPGKYRLRGWHPRAGERSVEVDVAAGDDKTPTKNQLLVFGNKS